MAYRTHKDGIIAGAIVGAVFGLLMHFRIFRVIVFLGIAYLAALPLYDYFFTQAYAAPSEYSMRVAAENVPTLQFTRDNPQWGVTVEMTNKGQYKIRQWSLHGKLYDCPRAFAPIDTCRFVIDQGTWVTDVVRPGETMTSKINMTFWPTVKTYGQLRVLWSVGEVRTDTDTELDKTTDEFHRALAEYASHGAPRN